MRNFPWMQPWKSLKNIIRRTGCLSVEIYELASENDPELAEATLTTPARSKGKETRDRPSHR